MITHIRIDCTDDSRVWCQAPNASELVSIGSTTARDSEMAPLFDICRSCREQHLAAFRGEPAPPLPVYEAAKPKRSARKTMARRAR